MGVSISNKELSASSIECGGSLDIKLSLSAGPDIVSNPAEIVLILDRSRSMSGSPMANLKVGAKTFIDIIAESTGGTADGEIGYGSRIGIVSFAATATQNTGLITSVSELKSAVDLLTTGGSTNHSDAFEKALDLFDFSVDDNKVMVMFTDGETTTGGDAAPAAASAKAKGVTIYCIGLSGSGGFNEDALNEWASSPPYAYVAITPDEEKLEEIFADLAKNIVKPGATGVEIRDVVNPCFKITSVKTPTKGTASTDGSNALRWKIPELGVSYPEGAELVFTVQHVGDCTGEIEVNESITYSDNEKNKVDFPSPLVNVSCGTVVTPEECPPPVTVCFDVCEDSLEANAGEIEMGSLGRILQLDVTLKNVCPGKRVALAVILTEEASCGRELTRGFKTLTIPAHNKGGCRNVTVRCIRFVLPEDLNTSSCQSTLCCKRKIKARVLANYIDADFTCSCAII